MDIMEAIQKELNKKPTSRAWQNLCRLFNEATEEERKAGLELAKPILKSKKWKAQLRYDPIEVDASLPIHPLLSFPHKATIDLKGQSSISAELGSILAKSQVRTLKLIGCEQLTYLSELCKAKKVVDLNISWCRNLASIEGFEQLTSLQALDISGSWYLKDFSPLTELRKLKRLHLTELTALEDCTGLQSLIHLKELLLVMCEQLTSLAGIEHMESLSFLDLTNCDVLRNIKGLSGLTHLKTIYLSGADWLDVLPEESDLRTSKKIKAYLEAIQQYYVK